MVIIRNLDVCEDVCKVASDHHQIRGGLFTIAQESLTFFDTDLTLFVSTFASTDGISIALASAATATMSSLGDSSSSSFSSAAI